MTSYSYRDSRRQILSDALAAINEDQVDLQTILEAEQNALQTDDWTVTDATYIAVGLDWVWSIRLVLKSLVDDDPAFVALGRTATLSIEQAGAIEDIPHGPGGQPVDYLDRLRIAIGEDETVFMELLHAAHRRWILEDVAQREYPFDDVGVLLPLRLETVFDAPGSPFNEDPDHWKLSLRVIPDEASIRRDNSFVSDGEASALVAFWQVIKQPGDLTDIWLEGDIVPAAWQLLCDRVTAPRAAWLVSRIDFHQEGETVILDLPGDMPPTMPPNCMAGLPPEFYVFAVDDGMTRHTIGRLPMDEAAQIDPANLTLPLPASLDEEKQRWWASWETAKAVGLGGEWLLPAGVTPETLDALYVVGIGDETPEAHFNAQIDAGEMGLLRLGTPTNSIQGKDAADRGQDAVDWRTVAQMRLRQRLNPLQNPTTLAAQMIQQHLTGSGSSLSFFPGSDLLVDDTLASQSMMKALFPGLWGHWLRELWQSWDDMYRVATWAYNYLMPEGPLMPIRIGDQPYGLLPVTALSQWEADITFFPDQQPQRQLEMNMASSLTLLRSQWADRVREKRSIVKKSTRQFIDLLAQDGLSSRYIWRYLTPAWVKIANYAPNDDQLQDFFASVRDAYLPATNLFNREPSTLYLAGNYPHFIRLPLVQPTRMMYRYLRQQFRKPHPLTEFLSQLFDFQLNDSLDEYDIAAVFQQGWSSPEHGDYFISTLPDSLLIRLLVYATQTAYSWRLNMTGSAPEQLILDWHQKAALELAEMIDNPDWCRAYPDPMSLEETIFTQEIPDHTRQQLERSFCATLDTAAHRIDPWITGFAWQRLQKHSQSPRHRHRLGVYGWVDGSFDGQPGPTNAGRLHTPSYNQTLAGIILRDKFLSSTRASLTNDSGDNPWAMNISSSKARLAEEIANEIQMGFHIYEIVGRHVEHIIGNHTAVKALRTNPAYAMYPERCDPKEVCNGHDALRGLLAGDPAFELSDEQRRVLQHLSDTLDTYGDLLMADGVLQLVNRQIDRAAKNMDAAAGFSQPPTFEFTRTPPSGYQLESVVLSALPYIPVESIDPGSSPARIADPSIASFLDNIPGDWTWQAINDDDATLLGAVTLVELGLSPVDTLGLSMEFMSELIRYHLNLPLIYITEAQNRAWNVSDEAGNFLARITLIELNMTPETMTALDNETLHHHIRAAAGAADNALITDIVLDDGRIWLVHNEYQILNGIVSAASLGLAPDTINLPDAPVLYQQVRQVLGVPQVRINTPRQYQLVREVTAALGIRPAAGRDFTEDKAAQAVNDVAIFSELRNRYLVLYDACQQLIDALRAAADDGTRAEVLSRAVLWGVIPTTDAADRKTLMAALSNLSLPAVEATPLDVLVEKVAKTLEGRLAAAPRPADLPAETAIGAPLQNHETLKKQHIPDGVPSLSHAIANLAAPNSKLTILACWQQDAVVNATKLVTTQPEPTLDENWLTVVATTRPPLARLEALQLELVSSLDAWSSSPDDPWQKAQVNANLQQRENSKLFAAACQLRDEGKSQPETEQALVPDYLVESDGGDNGDPLAREREAKATIAAAYRRSTTPALPRFTVAYGIPDAWAGEKVAVGLVDAFSEAVPMPQRSTSTAFGFNAPSARSPQAILLAVPPRPRQHLNPELLLQIMDETRELAHARTALIEDIGDLQSLTPAMWLQTTPPIRVQLNPYPLFE